MYIRQVPAKRYNLFKNNLDKYVGCKPMEAYYKCDININGTLYRLQLQLCNRCRIIPLQAIRLNIDTDKHELITDPMMLSALTEFVLTQYGAIKGNIDEFCFV